MKKKIFALLTALCMTAAVLPAVFADGEEGDLTIGSTQEQCSCVTLCTEDNKNPDCPVCSAEGVTACKGTAVLPMLLGGPTARAAENAPGTLYVGNQSLSIADNSFWTTDSSTGSLTSCSEDDSWNVKYDPATATLTLKDAKIKGGSNNNESLGAGIYAQCNSDQSVSLTIELIGNNNTITGSYGIYVNAEMDTSIYGTNATLTITGENNGSLGVSGSDHGIYVKSGSGDASLNIKNVAVTSSTNGNYAAGVYVMSSSNATGSPNLSLAVNGGSLTASSGTSSDGILFYVGNPYVTDAATKLTVGGNAIVDARNGGISASRIEETLPTPTPTGDNSSGIVFDGSTGTVYGSVTLQDDLTISEGETLTVQGSSSLTVPEGTTLTNDGIIQNNGTIDGDGTLYNNGTLTGRETVTCTVVEPTQPQPPQPTDPTTPETTAPTDTDHTVQTDNSGHAPVEDNTALPSFWDLVTQRINATPRGGEITIYMGARAVPDSVLNALRARELTATFRYGDTELTLTPDQLPPEGMLTEWTLHELGNYLTESDESIRISEEKSGAENATAAKTAPAADTGKPNPATGETATTAAALLVAVVALTGLGVTLKKK